MEQEYFGVSLEKLLTSGGQTLYMVAWSLIIGTIIGIILALILVLCRKGGLIENLILYNIVSIYINIVRSIPFVILLVAIMPLTRAIVGTTIGSTASLVPLVISVHILHALWKIAYWRLIRVFWKRLKQWGHLPGRRFGIFCFRKHLDLSYSH